MDKFVKDWEKMITGSISIYPVDVPTPQNREGRESAIGYLDNIISSSVEIIEKCQEIKGRLILEHPEEK